MQGKDLSAQEKASFIKKLRATNGNVAKACQAIKRSRNVVYDHRKKDADFAALWNEALEITYDAMEQEMYRRAVVGVVEPLISRGQIVKDDDGNPIKIRKYSDRLLEFALKGNRPEKFRERIDMNQTVSGSLDVNLEAEIDHIFPDDELEPQTDKLLEGEKEDE